MERRKSEKFRSKGESKLCSLTAPVGDDRVDHMKTTTLKQRIVISIICLLAGLGLSSIVRSVIDYYIPPPSRIPLCLYAPDVIIGSGEYNPETGFWSEYDCVSEAAFVDSDYVDRKSGK